MGLECLLTSDNGYIYLPSKPFRKPQKLEATDSIAETQPISMVSVFDPDKAREIANLPPDPGPYEDPPKMPKFLKPYWRDKEIPKVLRRVFGKTIKLTAWMKEIAKAMVDDCKGQRHIDPRRFRNQFRRYVTLEKRARYTMKLMENPPPPEPPPLEFGKGELPRGGEDMVPDEDP
ncbi:uncharacterized protein LOC128983200 isoform X2 [Macrosteles quadrilineatus]|nr:uncharacterized protein LOC128983200 isoform X2 [Macrosteles quadrilineatus]XP_054258371.1 uncharacterized protein LOC128983200 isoform X2 [Macrosteles quadrilineatus]